MRLGNKTIFVFLCFCIFSFISRLYYLIQHNAVAANTHPRSRRVILWMWKTLMSPNIIASHFQLISKNWNTDLFRKKPSKQDHNVNNVRCLGDDVPPLHSTTDLFCQFRHIWCSSARESASIWRLSGPNIGSMLGQRRRWLTSIVPTLDHWSAFADFTYPGGGDSS